MFSVEAPAVPLSNAEVAKKVSLSQMAQDAKCHSSVSRPSSTVHMPKKLEPMRRKQPEVQLSASAAPEKTSLQQPLPAVVPIIAPPDQTVSFGKVPVNVPGLPRGVQRAAQKAASLSEIVPPALPTDAYDPASSSTAGWVTYRRTDGTPYFFHPETGTTAWDWRVPFQPPLGPQQASTAQPVSSLSPPSLCPTQNVKLSDGADSRTLPPITSPSGVAYSHPYDAHPGNIGAAIELSGMPAKAGIDHALTELISMGGRTNASCAPPVGDPTLPWTQADWDLILVLDLPEHVAASAAASVSCSSSAGKAARQAQRRSMAQLKQMSEERRSPRHSGLAKASELQLRKGLQLGDSDQPADETASMTSSTGWLISELRRRVLLSGLACKVVKLTPVPDGSPEAAGEIEVESGHVCTLICIGAKKHVRFDKQRPPPPPPTGAQTLLHTKEGKAAIKVRRMASRAVERFPRLEVEAERHSFRMRTKIGVWATFRSASSSSFPSFDSANRQRLIKMALQAPLAEGVGAGLDLESLLSSKRVREIIYVHDDDEVEHLKRKLVYSSAGVVPLSKSTLRSLHQYVGAEVGFYFAWVAAYTRALWLPALIGLALFIADTVYFDDALSNTADPSAKEQDNHILRAILAGGFALVMLLWSSGFEEYWKRSQASIATSWDEADTRAKARPVNPRFHARSLKPGFYTEQGLFVSLEDNIQPKKIEKNTKKARRGRIVPLAGNVSYPINGYFPYRVRIYRQMFSMALLGLMGVFCLICIFLMQWFAAFLETKEVVIGGVDISSYTFSVCNSFMIMFFNIAWRIIALWLSSWENHRLEERYREKLTYKLFIFQCINCYFSLFYIAFLKPYGIQLFGIPMASCEIRPADSSTPSCTDSVRQLLLSILIVNILIGNAVEVGALFIGGVVKKVLSGMKERRRQAAAVKRAKFAVAPDDEDLPIDLNTLAKKKKRGELLTEAEEVQYNEQKQIIDVIAEYERVPVKSVKQGLGSTFYEYNELVIQYGYVIMFSVALPIAPLLALINNLVEVRSDALKLVYAARRIRAEPASNIGPWSRALRVLSYMGIACNLAFLTITYGFFDTLQPTIPLFKQSWARVVFIISVEHVLLAVKVTIDFCVPDVPDRIKIKLARNEYVVNHSILEMAGASRLNNAGNQVLISNRFRSYRDLSAA